VECIQREPAQATKKTDNAKTCSCLLTYCIWPTFGQQPIGLIPFFPVLLADVACLIFYRLIRFSFKRRTIQFRLIIVEQ
jgi:hypothetical protein